MYFCGSMLSRERAVILVHIDDIFGLASCLAASRSDVVLTNQ